MLPRLRLRCSDAKMPCSSIFGPLFSFPTWRQVPGLLTNSNDCLFVFMDVLLLILCCVWCPMFNIWFFTCESLIEEDNLGWNSVLSKASSFLVEWLQLRSYFCFNFKFIIKSWNFDFLIRVIVAVLIKPSWFQGQI